MAPMPSDGIGAIASLGNGVGAIANSSDGVGAIAISPDGVGAIDSSSAGRVSGKRPDTAPAGVVRVTTPG